MRRVISLFLVVVFLGATALRAQEAPPLTNDDIVGLVKAGLSPALIVAKISGSTSRFDTSPASLQQLKGAGVPDEVMLAMIQAASGGTAGARTRVKDEMTSQFQKLQATVVTVWSETGHGTGFIVDPTGLIMTNHHVVGPSEYIAVQFDSARKIPAVLLASDPLKDVAVVWANISAIPEAASATISKANPTVEEGERVFTIGSPLNQKKILTTGIASKVEARAILSDVNINHGNSGGPLFNSIGEVVGITTFGDLDNGGPGVSGIVRIEETLKVLEDAKAAAAKKTIPEARLLPVEPSQPFPIEAIREAARTTKRDLKPYVFGAGDYDVGVLTPMLLYRGDEDRAEAVRSKEKRTKQQDDTFDPSANLYNWQEYVGEYQAVVTIRATPKLRETFWSALGRGLSAASGNYNTGQATMKFKTDFLRMTVMCGSKVIEPIQPSKIARLVNVNNYFVKATDATYEGLYSYPIEAFAPECGTVTLQLFSEKSPKVPTVKVFDRRTTDRVWMDFESWRAARHP